MLIEPDETIRQLVVAMVEDFRNQLNGPFHRGGIMGLSFSAVRGLGDDEVRGFQIVTGGSEWQEQLYTIRTCNKGSVEQRKVSSRVGQIVEEVTPYNLWMDVSTLEGLHEVARAYVQESEAARDYRRSLDREDAIFSKVLDKAFSYYRLASETPCQVGLTTESGE